MIPFCNFVIRLRKSGFFFRLPFKMEIETAFSRFSCPFFPLVYLEYPSSDLYLVWTATKSTREVHLRTMEKNLSPFMRDCLEQFRPPCLIFATRFVFTQHSAR